MTRRRFLMLLAGGTMGLALGAAGCGSGAARPDTLRLCGPALAEPPAAPALPVPSFTARRETLPATVGAPASRRLAAQRCRGPPAAA